MKKFYIVIILSITVCVFNPSASCAIGETGAQFLKIGTGTKACAMGEAFTAVADDPTAIYWNPAGLTQMQSLELLGMQNFWFADMSSQYLAGVVPVHFGNLGVSAAYFSSGDIPKYENFINIGEYSSYDVAGTIAYAAPFGDFFSFGMGFKYLQLKIEDESADCWAFDFGFLYKQKALEGLRLGISVLNVGPGITFIESKDPLPLNPRVGVSYRFESFLIACDINKFRDNEVKFNFGTAFLIRNVLELYCGYNTYEENESISGGLSVLIGKIDIGYAIVSHGDLENTHRISIALGL